MILKNDLDSNDLDLCEKMKLLVKKAESRSLFLQKLFIIDSRQSSKCGSVFTNTLPTLRLFKVFYFF